jgi:hypothetical protein
VQVTAMTAAPLDTTAPLDGPGSGDDSVSVDDPLPPQADADADAATAEAAVRYAFTHWILVDLDPDLRSHLVEDGEANRDQLHEGFQANRGLTEFARFEVDAVRFVSATEAEVVFRIRWHDGPSPYFPDALTGTAVFADGTWRVGTATTCRLALGAQQGCRAEAGDPEPAAALVATAVPGDLVRQDPARPGGADEIAVGPAGQAAQAVWATSGTRRATLTMTVRHVRGLARGGDPEAAFGGGGFNGADAEVVTVAGDPGRLVRSPGAGTGGGSFVRLRWVRTDDVVVDLDADGLSADEVLAFAEGVRTADS